MGFLDILSVVANPVGTIASTLIGGIAGSASTDKAADASLQATRETNQTNIQLAREQQEWQEDMINLQNEYNSPLAQKQRYMEAGINPYMAMAQGSLGSGNQNTIPAYQRAQAENPAQYILQGGIAQANVMQRTSEQVIQGLSVAAQNSLAYAQVAKTKQDTRFFMDNYDTYSLMLDTQLANMQLDNTRRSLENDILGLNYTIQNRYGFDTAQWNLNGMIQQVYESLAREGLLTAQGVWTEADIGRIDAAIKLMGSQVMTEAYKRLNLSASAANYYAQASLAQAQEGLVKEEERGLKMKNDLFDTSMPYLLQGVKATAQMKRYEQQILGYQSKIADKTWKIDVAAKRLGLVNKGLSTGKNALDAVLYPQEKALDFFNKGASAFGSAAFGTSFLRNGSRTFSRSYNPQLGWSYHDSYTKYDYWND